MVQAVQRDSSREILLTFSDRGLVRTPNAAPGQYFRRSGEYQSTTWSRSVAAGIARDYSLTTVVEWPIRALGVHCVVYSVDETQSVDEVVGKLATDTRVEAVQRMNTFHALNSEDPYKSLQTSFFDMQVEPVHHLARGKGVSIAIIDTGVDVGHPDLAGQVTEQLDLTDSTSRFDRDIHGTAVAGIIAALSGNGLGIEGIAPQATLFALRACWPVQPDGMAAVCNSLTLAKALDSAIYLRPRIINLSLTGPSDPLVEALLRVAVRDSIVMVAAEPGEGASTGFIRGIDGIIRVKSSRGQGPGPAVQSDDTIIAASGLDVLTTFPGGTYDFASGSSFAAANVSGIIALLLELEPELTPREIRELLMTGMDNAVGEGSGAGSSYLNVCRVVASLLPEYHCANNRDLAIRASRE